jgi:HEAT repeat protein
MLVLIAVCAAFLAVFQYRWEVYDPTSARLRQVRYADTAGKVAAMQGLRDGASGAAVVETLLGALVDADSAVRAAAARAMIDVIVGTPFLKKPDDPYARAVKAALTDALRDSDPTVRLQAASGLSELRVKSPESFAILLRVARTAAEPIRRFRVADEPDDRSLALWSLANSYRDEPEALAALLDAMTDRDRIIRERSISFLYLHLRDSAGAIPEPIAKALCARLEDEDDHVCASAAQTMVRFGRRVGRGPVPLLIRKLANPRSSTRVWAADALRDFGLEAEEALPALRALAEGTSEVYVRSAAREAVEKIDKASRTFHEQTLPNLIADLGNEDPDRRALAAAALAVLGTRAKAAVPDLIKALDDPEPKVRRAASAALVAAGVTPPESRRQPSG